MVINENGVHRCPHCVSPAGSSLGDAQRGLLPAGACGGLPAGSQHPARGRLAGEWVSTVSGVLGRLGDLEMESI